MAAINNVGDLTGALQRFQNNQIVKINGRSVTAVVGQRGNSGVVNIYTDAVPTVSQAGIGIIATPGAKLLEED